jgi:hypothetical protein
MRQYALSAFSKVELRFPIHFEDAAIGHLKGHGNEADFLGFLQVGSVKDSS